MDREIIFAVAIAIGAMLGFSGFFLSSSAPSEPNARPTYSPDDIRYKYQQADLKKPKRAKQTVSPSAPRHSTSSRKSAAGTYSAGGSSGSDDSSSDATDNANEEPSLTDHEPQEEPEIE